MPTRRVALSTSWLTHAHGWVAVAEPCATSQCMALYATSDAGRHWTRVASPAPRLVQPVGVLLVDAQVGYIFSGGMFMTRDGGRHWMRASLPNVSALLGAAPSVVALTYDHSG